MKTNSSTISNVNQCPAFIITAPSSGSGKTTITAALARYHREQGRKVTVFKVGPDFIDPMILNQASGELVYQLDLWLVGEAGCRDLLYRAAQTSDLILIEGVMGLFDGTPSSADLAETFNIPVVGVIDARAMAQTFSAVAFGLANYRPELPFAGVVANRVTTARHEELIKEGLSPDIHFYGRIPTDDAVTLPQRHLGLVQSQELADIDQQLNKAAEHIANTGLAELPAPVDFYASEHFTRKEADMQHVGKLAGKRLIIVKDKAFSFIYAANIDFLTQTGAELVFASALNDAHLPEGDLLYIPGGYPELYAKKLSENKTFIADVKSFALSQKPLLAECGGMMYLLNELTDMDGQVYNMTGVLSGQATMQKKVIRIGSQSVEFPALDENAESRIMRGHSYHYSTSEISLTPIAQSKHHPTEKDGEMVYQQGNVIASYMHWYLPSNPSLALSFFGA